MRNEADDSMKEFMREMRSVRNSAAGENEADPGLVRGKRTGVKVERKRVRKVCVLIYIWGNVEVGLGLGIKEK